MKVYINKASKLLIAAVVAFATFSCDLELQKEWEYVPEPFGNKPTGMSALEWLEMINSDPTYQDANGLPEFNYLLEAIARTGLEDLYLGQDTTTTYLLLRNSAWNGNNQLIQNMAGNRDYPLDSISNERLEHVLRYHIIDEYLSQPAIPKNDFFLYYQTLVPGDSGSIEINKRLFDQSIRINTSIARIGSPSTPSNMPSTSRGTVVNLHNFIFTNGIGHQLNSYVRYQPF
ncbi:MULTISPECIES: fasciclin domain-containing protein [Algoriphagus]|jgi:hypothetical protein|uniref:Fasciclin domain-containing protein n=2 Tax=Algoriphagus TaxID=246875 RepID=A0A2W7R9Q5_9BACT|nr:MULTISPECIES: fasciclin domain-containing protein [Algoriphagus]PZX56791.1 fasciclin domain-containing protein [Algoriphagus chordae]SMP21125.1 Fasciclin domain-containing protein [Algoriphagus winogradskyi]